MERMAKVLTIAGSDSSGGAGIQADLKTMMAHGVYGMSAVTALTAQNTAGVAAVQEVTPEFLAAEIDAVFEDIRPDARFCQCVRSGTEFIRSQFLMVIRHHRPVAGDHFLHRAVQFSQELLTAAGEFPYLLRQELGGTHCQQHGDTAQKGQLPAIPEHHCHSPAHHQYTGEQGGEGL